MYSYYPNESLTSLCLQKRNHRANEYIHIVKPNLTLAVAQCIEAAGHEFNPSHQKMLMTAAQYGKCFLHNFDSTNYVKMLRVLRLLNQVRDPQIGIAITYEQLNQLGIDKLIDMLILRRFYYLALQISKYLRLSSAEGSVRILSHWAYYKVSYLRLFFNGKMVKIGKKTWAFPISPLLCSNKIAVTLDRGSI